MIFKFTEEEQAQIIQFEQRAKEKLNLIKYKTIAYDWEEAAQISEFEIIIPPKEQPKDHKEIKQQLESEFETLIDQMEQKRFETLKTTPAIITDAENTIKDAIIFNYNISQYFEYNIPSEEKHIEIGLLFDNKHLCNYLLFSADSKQLFNCAIEKPIENIYVLLDREAQKKFLITKALKNHINRLAGTKSEKELYKRLDYILEYSKYISNNFYNSNTKRKTELNEFYNVTMANVLIQSGINTLNANELKLLRLAIMQSKQNDSNFYEYEVSAKELSDFFKIDRRNLYKNLDTMTDHIQQAFIKIKSDRTQKFIKQSWVDRCEYNNGQIYIKLSEGLKPYILDLKCAFSKIEIGEYIKYRSQHTIIIRELIEAELGANKPAADNVVNISIPLEKLRQVTNTEKEYTKISRFRAQVIDVAIKEINEFSNKYHISATPYKRGKSIIGFNFTIESAAHFAKYNLLELPPVEDEKV